MWYKVRVTELERALLDLAEVRDRLAMAQRFKGYSAVAAAASGMFAIVAGIAQALVVPAPHTAHQDRLYFAIWMACCAAAVLVNYGAIAHWAVSDESVRDRWQTRTVGLSILPSILFGAALSFALLAVDAIAFLPGIWFAAYGVGLFASRTMIPRGVVPIAALFLIAGGALLFAPPSLALAWWVPAIGFGAGQTAIGYFVFRDRAVDR